MKGFILPLSMPNVSLSLFLRCCAMKSFIVSSKVWAPNFLRSFSSIFNVLFETLIVVASLTQFTIYKYAVYMHINILQTIGKGFYLYFAPLALFTGKTSRLALMKACTGWTPRATLQNNDIANWLPSLSPSGVTLQF